jgi:hypothetical protein
LLLVVPLPQIQCWDQSKSRKLEILANKREQEIDRTASKRPATDRNVLADADHANRNCDASSGQNKFLCQIFWLSLFQEPFIPQKFYPWILPRFARGAI